MGNTGIRCDDSVEKNRFSFYITKGTDIKLIRYFLKYTVSDKPLAYFEKNIDEISELASKKYEEWNYDVLIKEGKKIEMES
jgi:hypothetical protein